jgi:protein SCO1/2
MTWIRKRPILMVAAVVIGLLLLALVGYRVLALSQARELEVFGDAPTFVLTDQLERPVRSEELRGKVVIANFIYTNCPDICPLLSLRMQALQERLRKEGLLGREVQLLSFTVDPARDTPAVLRAYAERHRADPDAWRFLTGPENVVVPLIVDGFKLGVQALPPQGTNPSAHTLGAGHTPSYEVMHSGRFVLIDRQGRIRAYYDGRALDRERLMRDIRALLWK